MSLLYLIVSLPFAILTACLGLELLMGSWPLKQPPFSPIVGTAVVVVPAHNEELLIGARLRDLLVAAEGQASILVIADNCSDRTALIARDLGIEVYERSDSQRRGKGYALAAAKEYLQPSPPKVVVIIDADCWTDRASLGNLISACLRSGLPAQAAYLQAPSHDASVLVQLSTFAFFVKNLIRQRGLQRLAGRSLLVGSGMAFPWRSFATSPLATANLVEDLQLGLDLANRGEPPQLVESAVVWGPTETQSGALSQRQRWEGGLLRTAIRAGPTMMLNGLRELDVQTLWAGLSLTIPPLTLLVAIDLILLASGFGLGFAIAIPPSALAPLLASFSVLAVMLATIWLTGGHRFVAAKSLIKLPLFLVWKIPMYAALLWRGAPAEWKRTDR